MEAIKNKSSKITETKRLEIEESLVETKGFIENVDIYEENIQEEIRNELMKDESIRLLSTKVVEITESIS